MLVRIRFTSSNPAMQALGEALPTHIARRAHDWLELWQLAGIADSVRLRYSRRMFRSVGRCMPARRLVTLAAGVREMPEALLLDVLCHELAHIAAYEHHGRAIRPHGPEWQALMRRAGFEPRVRFDDGGAINLIRSRAAMPVRYLHRCPVCAAARTSNRRMPRWRCGECYARGRDGRLEIVRMG